MDKQYKNVYEECLSSGIYEDSEEGRYDPPAQNAWEKNKWNSNGYNQSGTKYK